MPLTFTQYFNQPNAERITLVEITQGATTYYLSDRPYSTTSSDAVETVYNHIISKNGLPRLQWKISDALTGEAVKNYGKLTLIKSLLIDGTDLTLVDLRGASVVIKVAGPRRLYPYADAVTLMTAKMGASSGSGLSKLVLLVEDDQAVFDKLTVPANRYSDTGQPVDFPSESKGQIIPLSLGSPLHVSPILIDQVAFWYQFSDITFDSVFAIDRVYDGGLELARVDYAVSATAMTVDFPVAFSAIDNFYVGVEYNDNLGNSRIITGYVGATRRATVNAAFSTIPNASTLMTIDLFEKDIANARLRLLSQAIGIVTCSVTGVTAANYTAGAIDSLVKNIGGLVAGSIDIVLANITPIGIYLSSELTLSQLLTKLCVQRFAFWGFDRSGQFIVREFNAAGVPQHIINGYEIVEASWREHPKLIWRYVLKHTRRWTVNLNPASSISAFYRNYIATEYNVEEDADAAIKNAYPYSVEHVFDTFFRSNNNTVLGAMKIAWGVPRKLISITAPMKLPLININDEVVIQQYSNRYDGSWRVVGITDQVGGSMPTQKLELWG